MRANIFSHWSKKDANRLQLVIVVDIFIALLAVPMAFLLGHINLAITPEIYVYWILIPIVMTAIFSKYRLYSSLWRFASSSDFLNIAIAVFLTTLCLYVAQVVFSAFDLLPAIDGRAFIILGLLLAVFISLSRIAYRLLSDMYIHRSGGVAAPVAKSAIFIGSVQEAALAMRQLTAKDSDTPGIGAIIATDNAEIGGTYLSGVIVRKDISKMNFMIAESKNGAVPFTHVIIGNNGFANDDERVETIRRARAAGLLVMTFRGLENANVISPARLFREVDVLSMLNRSQYVPDDKALSNVVSNRRILVTGGAGSIGSQLAKRCITLGAAQVIIVDRSEAGVFHWLKSIPADVKKNVDARVADVSSKSDMTRVFAEFKPDIVFHAAALKHVPLVETNWSSAIRTNVLGTWICAQLAKQFNAERFVFISTDKAVEPTTFLGQTKRFGELISGSMNAKNDIKKGNGLPPTRFTSVRFGNVFGTEGSVVNVFEEQIRAGEPLTITHPDMRRYFMTAKEASSLVILSASIDEQDTSNRPHIYILEMGEQIKILDIAHAMIRLAGKNPDLDVEINITGVRQHEKMEEKLVSDHETVIETKSENVLIAKCPVLETRDIEGVINQLIEIADSGTYDDALRALVNAEKLAVNGDSDGRVIPLNRKR